jgi:hypothetical protein
VGDITKRKKKMKEEERVRKEICEAEISVGYIFDPCND